MKDGKLIIISGPSGVGKGTIIAALLKENRKAGFQFCLSVSATTRSKRPDEVDGQDYYFLTEQQFDEKRAFFTEGADLFEKADGIGFRSGNFFPIFFCIAMSCLFDLLKSFIVQ